MADRGASVLNIDVEEERELARSLVEALTEAHEDLAAAQTVSKQPGAGVYALIWRSLWLSLGARLGARFDVQRIKLRRAPYDVFVIGDALLFPWRPPGGHEPSEVSFGTSPTRQGLWSVSLSQDLLNFEPSSPPEAVDAEVEEAFGQASERHLRVVLVAMTSSAERLRRIEWGEVSLVDGMVNWLSHEVLFDDVASTKLIAVGSVDFHHGTPPAPRIALRAAVNERVGT